MLDNETRTDMDKLKNITEFINDKLKPRFYDNVPLIFPSHEFKKKGAQWISPMHADLSESTGERADRCVVTERQPTKVFDNTRQQATDLITLFMQLNNITEVWQAVNELCKIVGINPPEYSPEAIRQYRKAEERRTALELSHERQQKALFAPEGAAVLSYLYGRGWTTEEIKRAQLGYISEAEAHTINAQNGIGTTYVLSIPLRSGSSLYGFKFRLINPEEGKSKYVYLVGTSKSENLFNLPATTQRDGSIVVVEGELDALHADAKRLKGFVATGGGALSKDLLSVCSRRGIKNVTLLFDADERGEKFTNDSIKNAFETGMTVFVALFPEEEVLADGTKIHDVDEYLRKHKPEELQALIEGAMPAARYLFQEAEKEVLPDGGEYNERTLNMFLEKLLDVANSMPNELDREYLFNMFARTITIDGTCPFTPESVRAVADRRRERALSEYQKAEVTKVMEEALNVAKTGEPRRALELVNAKVKEFKDIDSREKFRKLFALPNSGDLFRRLQSKTDDLPTNYKLSNGKDTEVFTLPAGAITFICGGTSHGKSTFLQNLALQVSMNGNDGSVLYFSFEEDKDAITLQFLNKYINEPLCNNYDTTKSNNLRAIRHYFKTGEDRYIKTEKRAAFLTKNKAFFDGFYNNGKLRIYYEDFDSGELIEAIRVISGQTKVKAVFIDYIQLLSSTEYRRRRMPRTEEIKEICKDLKDLCVETNLPIVVAAQLNRQVNSPLEMYSQNLAEAADLERIANKVLCLWNTAFQAQKKDNAKELEELEKKLGFTLGSGGKIYAKLTKNRGGVVGLEAAFMWNGNTGVISGNVSKLQNSNILTTF